MTPREIALSYLESFSSGDPEKISAHVSENFTNNQMGLIGSGCTGRNVYRGKLKGFLSTFENLHYTVEDVLCEGNRVAVCYRMHAQDQGRPLEIPGVMMITISDGLIDVRSDYWDGLTYFKQIGAELPL